MSIKNLNDALTPASVNAFLKVAETLSFTRTGEILGLTQPAVTASVKRLEEILGVALFIRTPNKGVHLTVEGEELRGFLVERQTHTDGFLKRFSLDAKDVRLEELPFDSLSDTSKKIAIRRFRTASTDAHISKMLADSGILFYKNGVEVGS